VSICINKKAQVSKQNRGRNTIISIIIIFISPQPFDSSMRLGIAISLCTFNSTEKYNTQYTAYNTGIWYHGVSSLVRGPVPYLLIVLHAMRRRTANMVERPCFHPGAPFFFV
jgi:hypothetical protein